ncbi:MAG: hypothetical protein ACOC5T_05015 [Elusimicrobiota bacterium]
MDDNIYMIYSEGDDDYHGGMNVHGYVKTDKERADRIAQKMEKEQDPGGFTRKFYVGLLKRLG